MLSMYILNSYICRLMGEIFIILRKYLQLLYLNNDMLYLKKVSSTFCIKMLLRKSKR